MSTAADFLKWCEVFKVNKGGSGGPVSLQSAYDGGPNIILSDGTPINISDSASKVALNLDPASKKLFTDYTIEATTAGFTSHLINQVIPFSHVITQTDLDRTNLNNTTNNYILTFPTSDTFDLGSTFTVVQLIGGGSIQIDFPPGVFLNGIDNTSIIVNIPYQNLTLRKIAPQQYMIVYNSISGSLGGTALQGSFTSTNVVSSTPVTPTSGDVPVAVDSGSLNVINPVGTAVSLSTISGVQTVIIKNVSGAGRWCQVNFDLTMRISTSTGQTYNFTVYTNNGAQLGFKQITVPTTTPSLVAVSLCTSMLFLNNNDYVYLRVSGSFSPAASSFIATYFNGRLIDTSTNGTGGGATFQQVYDNSSPPSFNINGNGFSIKDPSNNLLFDITTSDSVNYSLSLYAQNSISLSNILNGGFTQFSGNSIINYIPHDYGANNPNFTFTAQSEIPSNIFATSGNYQFGFSDESTSPSGFFNLNLMDAGSNNVILYASGAANGNPALINVNSQLRVGVPFSPVNCNVKTFINGQNASGTNGPGLGFFTNADNYPLFQILPFSHGNVLLNFDCYSYNGSYYSSSASSNFQIGKTATQLQFNYRSGITPGSSFAFQPLGYFDTSGNFTLNGKFIMGVPSGSTNALAQFNSQQYGILFPILSNAQQSTLVSLLASIDQGLFWYNSTTSNYNYWTGSAVNQILTSATSYGINAIVTVTASTQSMVLQTRYINNYTSGQCTYTLPAATGSGKIIELLSLSTASTSGWVVNATSTAKIQFGPSLGASNGSLTSTSGSATDCTTFVDVAANLWLVSSALGSNLGVA